MKLIILLILTSFACIGQTSASVNISLPQISLMDIEPNNSAINLAILPTTEAGNVPGMSAADNSKWINFTSAVATGASRRISAQLSGSTLPGVSIILGVSTVSGTGAGSRGVRTPSITLSNSPQTIINSIGGAFTGNGVGNGYNLSYALNIVNFSQLKESSQTLTVVYTLIDN